MCGSLRLTFFLRGVIFDRYYTTNRVGVGWFTRSHSCHPPPHTSPVPVSSDQRGAPGLHSCTPDAFGGSPRCGGGCPELYETPEGGATGILDMNDIQISTRGKNEGTLNRYMRLLGLNFHVFSLIIILANNIELTCTTSQVQNPALSQV